MGKDMPFKDFSGNQTRLAFLLTILIFFAASCLTAQTNRLYYQKIELSSGLDILPIVTNTGLTHCAAYRMRAFQQSQPEYVLTTETHPASQIRIARIGNGTTLPYYAAVVIQLGAFPNGGLVGDSLMIEVTYRETSEIANWAFQIPAGTAYIFVNDPVQAVPPFAPYPVSISGEISGGWDCGGVTLTCSGLESQVTNNDGLYSFTVPPFQDYNITPSKYQYLFNPPSRTINHVNTIWTNQNFDIRVHYPPSPTNPSPSVTEDSVSIYLTQLSWFFHNSTSFSVPTGFKLYFPADADTFTFIPYSSNEQWFYYELPFDLELNTTYYWKVVSTCEPDGFDAPHTDTWVFTTTPVMHSVSGFITGIFPLDGVSLETYGTTCLTDSSGYYNLLVSPAMGYYTNIIPSKYRYRFSPDALSVTNLNTDLVNQDFLMIAHYPRPAVNPFPANGQDSVAVNLPNLTWRLGGGLSNYSQASGFKLYFPADADTFTWVTEYVSPNFQFELASSLEYDTSYTWKVVPTSQPGGFDADSCQVWTFRTEQSTGNNDLLNITEHNDVRLFPNPFKTNLCIEIFTDAKSQVQISVFDIKGRKIRTLHESFLKEGMHNLTWNGRDDDNQPVASGIYFIQYGSGRSKTISKVLYLK